VELYWIPLGAGGHCVRFNGRVFEAIQAAYQHRPRCDLYHAALTVELGHDRYTIRAATGRAQERPRAAADRRDRGCSGGAASREYGDGRSVMMQQSVGGWPAQQRLVQLGSQISERVARAKRPRRLRFRA
jgi:hypothetical protein